MPSLPEKSELLLAWFAPLAADPNARCVVAFSGGVDSAVVACAARRALGPRALAVTGVSASLARGELEAARALAEHIGVRHETLATDEFANPDYLRNAPDRCFHCKTELYTQLENLVAGLGARHADAVLVNGANVDDLGDYRPGLRAAQRHAVRSPLVECGLNKDDVRALARLWNLPVWDKPASPCLSSRVAYGLEVTPERLRRVDEAERFLRDRGVREARVRCHPGELARVEVPLEALPALCAPETRRALVEHLRSLGFRFVTLDLEGFRSGNLNALLPLSAMWPLNARPGPDPAPPSA